MDNEDNKEDSKSSKGNLFYTGPETQERGKNKIDAIADSQEDLEAVDNNGNIVDQNEATYQNLRGKKNNSLGNNANDNNKYTKATDAKKKLDMVNTEGADGKSQTDRKYNEERGGSAMPYENGNLDSPSSQANLKNKLKGTGNDNVSNSGKNIKNSQKSGSDGDAWKEDKKGQNEDEKHDEERSLLDPIADADIYGKDAPKEGKKQKRRTSTQPERQVLATPSRSRFSADDEILKEGEDDEEEEEIPPSECNQKSNLLLD